MFTTSIIGHIGADAVTKAENGRSFTTFRVAISRKWRDQQQVEHSETTWVDCVMNERPAVCDYLKQGAMVYVSGDTRLRVYSSAKDRCMKAGLSISVRQVELLGGSSDDVPRRLYDSDGALHEVRKAYYSDVKKCTLLDVRGGQFSVDKNGWITRVQANETDQSNQGAAAGEPF